MCAIAPVCDVFHIVDAITGERISHWMMYERLAADTSGALLWSSNDGAPIASSGVSVDGRVLQEVQCTRGDQSFRFGVVILRDDSLCRVLRFDVAQPTHKASNTVREVWCACKLTREKQKAK